MIRANLAGLFTATARQLAEHIAQLAAALATSDRVLLAITLLAFSH